MFPEIVPGVFGASIGVMLRQVGELWPQKSSAVTQMFPPVLLGVTLIDVVPCPELIVHPAGNDQV